MRISLFSAVLLLITSLASSGCAWLRPTPRHVGDRQLIQANSDLRLERNILREELVIVRREQDILRRTLDSRGYGQALPPGERETRLAAELASTAAELADLRARYARLESTRNVSGTDFANLAGQQRETEDRLAVVLRDFTGIQEENARLRSELITVKTENEALAQRALEAETSLGALNLELVAQREALAGARQQMGALRTQLQAVIATNTTNPRETTAGGSVAMSAASLTARVDPDGAVTTTAARRHRVVTGDTLASIAYDYYGSVERWRDIYAANLVLLRDNRPLNPGMELVVP